MPFYILRDSAVSESAPCHSRASGSAIRPSRVAVSHQRDKPESLSVITVNLTPKHHHDSLLLRLWLLLQQLIIYIFNSLPFSQTVLPTKALSSHSKSRYQQQRQWKPGSGQRYQIFCHTFLQVARVTKHTDNCTCFAGIARVLRAILACPCVF